MRKTKYFLQKEEKNVYKLYLYDDITSHGKFNWNTWEYDESETSAKHFSDELNQIPEDATIELHVNSYGGEVKEGVAIYNLLMQHKARKTGYVDAFACSAATLPLFACDKVIMGLGTYMLIHNMWMNVSGNAEELRAAADQLDQLMTANRQIYLSKMNCTEEELIELMNQEKYLTPDECLEYGICDEINTKMKTEEKKAVEEMQKVTREMQQSIRQNGWFTEEVKKLLEESGKRPQKDLGSQRGSLATSQEKGKVFLAALAKK